MTSSELLLLGIIIILPFCLGYFSGRLVNIKDYARLTEEILDLTRQNYSLKLQIAALHKTHTAILQNELTLAASNAKKS